MSDESVVDVTDRIEVYETGKVWSCDCGQDFGVGHGVRAKKCPTCGAINRDEEAELRAEQWEEKKEEQPDEEEQMVLGDFA